jgi:hypothetical protein
MDDGLYVNSCRWDLAESIKACRAISERMAPEFVLLFSIFLYSQVGGGDRLRKLSLSIQKRHHWPKDLSGLSVV